MHYWISERKHLQRSGGFTATNSVNLSLGALCLTMSTLRQKPKNTENAPQVPHVSATRFLVVIPGPNDGPNLAVCLENLRCEIFRSTELRRRNYFWVLAGSRHDTLACCAFGSLRLPSGSSGSLRFRPKWIFMPIIIGLGRVGMREFWEPYWCTQGNGCILGITHLHLQWPQQVLSTCVCPLQPSGRFQWCY